MKRLANLLSSLCGNQPRRNRMSHLAASETLETRVLLAGNVLAKLTGGGDLVLKGDSLSNHMHVGTTPGGGGVRVTGLADGDGAATTINGAAFVDYAGSDTVPDDLRAILRGGDDLIDVETDVAGNLIAKTGSGGDKVSTDGVVIGGKFAASLGKNTTIDWLLVENTTVLGSTTVKTGTGSGAEIDFYDSHIAGSMTITKKPSNNFLDIARVTVGGAANIKGGHYTILADCDFGSSLSVTLDSGDGTLHFIGDIEVDGSIDLDGGAGFDLLIFPPANASVRNFESF